MIKSFLKFLLFALAGLALIIYITSIGEGIENLNLKGNYFVVLPQTLEYFFLWVLPYWWPILLIAGIIIAAGLTILKWAMPNQKQTAKT